MGELDPRAVPCHGRQCHSKAGTGTAGPPQVLGMPGSVQGFPCQGSSLAPEQHPGMPQCQEMPSAFLVPQFPPDLMGEKEGKEEIF